MNHIYAVECFKRRTILSYRTWIGSVKYHAISFSHLKQNWQGKNTNANRTLCWVQWTVWHISSLSSAAQWETSGVVGPIIQKILQFSVRNIFYLYKFKKESEEVENTITATVAAATSPLSLLYVYGLLEGEKLNIPTILDRRNRPALKFVYWKLINLWVNPRRIGICWLLCCMHDFNELAEYGLFCMKHLNAVYFLRIVSEYNCEDDMARKATLILKHLRGILIS